MSSPENSIFSENPTSQPTAQLSLLERETHSRRSFLRSLAFAPVLFVTQPALISAREEAPEFQLNSTDQDLSVRANQIIFGACAVGGAILGGVVGGMAPETENKGSLVKALAIAGGALCGSIVVTTSAEVGLNLNNHP